MRFITQAQVPSLMVWCRAMHIPILWEYKTLGSFPIPATHYNTYVGSRRWHGYELAGDDYLRIRAFIIRDRDLIAVREYLGGNLLCT